MPPLKKKKTPSNQIIFILICLTILVLLTLVTWDLAWPLSWMSLPIFLVYGYTLFRILFEITINRNQHSPTLATSYIARQKIASILNEECNKKKKNTFTILDIGSGRGELAHAIAKKIQKAHVKGIEQAFFPYTEAVLWQKFFGPPNLSFERKDFWTYDYSKLDAVTLYLGPLTTEKMGKKLLKELANGSLVISHSYPLNEQWTPIETLEYHSPFKETTYIYRK